jgi:hypothetical protein
MIARALIPATAALLALALAGCNNQAELDAAARTASNQIERSAAIGALAHDYQQARAAQQWDLALSYANTLQRLAPNSALANTVQATLSDTTIHADEVRDRQRLAALWSYDVTEPASGVSDGMWVSASIHADSNSNPEGSASAKLVLRHHPKWGRSAAIVLDQGQFDCAPACKVSVKFDDQPARLFAATKSEQNRQALTFDDERTIRESLDKIRAITIDTSIDGKPRSLSFDVGGFDRVALERQMQ